MSRSTSDSRSARPVVVSSFLFAAAVVLAWLGSADPPIDTRNSAFWFRTLREVPGLTDVCGGFTWLARAVPPLLAAFGALVALIHRPRSATSIGVGVFGLALAAVLAYVTTQNAVPWGQLHCIA